MQTRKKPNYKLKVRLLQEANLICPFCGFSDASRLEHHHIDGDALNTTFENLISVCPNCHAEIESGSISKSKVIETKGNLSVKSHHFFQGLYKFDNFRIHENRVGIFQNGMTIKEVYSILPAKQIRKCITYGEHPGEDLYDSYEIYDFNGDHILNIEPAEHGSIDSPIITVNIHSTKFHTLTGVKLGAKFGDICKNQVVSGFKPDIYHIHFKIDWISASCSIKKTELTNEWWDDDKKKIIVNEINSDAVIDGITIYWN